MRVALVYDEPGAWPGRSQQPGDFGAEYEDERTIRALLEAIGACGHEALAVTLGRDFGQEISQVEPDLVFNIAEGVRGSARESLAPAVLDQLDIGYTGSDGLTLAVSLDKGLTKTLAMGMGVRTPAFCVVRSETELGNVDLGCPVFVKPNAEGSSMGIDEGSRVETAEDLRERVRYVLGEYQEDCLVEAFAPGREFCVGIIGNGQPEVLPVAEVQTETAFYTYREKSQHHKELICPAEVAEETAEEMRDMAVAVFTGLRCRDLARVDFRLDDQGRPTFLEINPLPGLSPYYSIFPCQAKAAGISYEDLIGRIIEAAVSRQRG